MQARLEKMISSLDSNIVRAITRKMRSRCNRHKWEKEYEKVQNEYEKVQNDYNTAWKHSTKVFPKKEKKKTLENFRKENAEELKRVAYKLASVANERSVNYAKE